MSEPNADEVKALTNVILTWAWSLSAPLNTTETNVSELAERIVSSHWLESVRAEARAEGGKQALLAAADDFARAASAGVEPVLNSLAAKLLRKRAHSPMRNRVDRSVRTPAELEGADR